MQVYEVMPRLLRSQSLIPTPSLSSHFSSFPIWYTKAKSVKSCQQLRAFGLASMVFLTICTSIHISIPVHRPLDSPRYPPGYGKGLLGLMATLMQVSVEESRLGHLLSQPVPGCLDHSGKLPV